MSMQWVVKVISSDVSLTILVKDEYQGADLLWGKVQGHLLQDCTKVVWLYWVRVINISDSVDRLRSDTEKISCTEKFPHNVGFSF